MTKIRRVLKTILWRLREYRIQLRLMRTRQPRIIYALTPPPRLSNIGDQAQVVAIYNWLMRHFPDTKVIELNKDEVNHLPALRKYVKNDDPIILHSGGNMGDRGIWSETARRLIIENFPANRIVSLPQTIYFSDTEIGRRELEKSRKIYNRHKNLVVIARDNKSYQLAKEYFPRCEHDRAPDFVLSCEYKVRAQSNGKALFCLREDGESALAPAERRKLFAGCPVGFDVFDTTLSEPIPRRSRATKLKETIDLFSQYEYVITDRFHGVIFAVLCKKPTIVLPTVDHKLTSAFDWFEDVKFVRFAKTVSEVPGELAKARLVEERTAPDWNRRYFDRIAEYVKG